jgi:hypothetical protein
LSKEFAADFRVMRNVLHVVDLMVGFGGREMSLDLIREVIQWKIAGEKDAIPLAAQTLKD